MTAGESGASGFWHQGRPLLGDDSEPHPLDADGVQPVRSRTVRLGDAWKARRDGGLPCWCGAVIGHVGWPTCADEHLPRCGDCAGPGPDEIDHGVLLCCNLPSASSDEATT